MSIEITPESTLHKGYSLPMAEENIHEAFMRDLQSVGAGMVWLASYGESPLEAGEISTIE